MQRPHHLRPVLLEGVDVDADVARERVAVVDVALLERLRPEGDHRQRRRRRRARAGRAGAGRRAPSCAAGAAPPGAGRLRRPVEARQDAGLSHGRPPARHRPRRPATRRARSRAAAAHESVTFSPRVARAVPSFCWTTVSSWPHGISTMYCVATPVKDTSRTMPRSRLGPPRLAEAQLLRAHARATRRSRRRAGARATPRGRCRALRTRDDAVAAARRAPVARSRLDWPRKFATKVDCGCS